MDKKAMWAAKALMKQMSLELIDRATEAQGDLKDSNNPGGAKVVGAMVKDMKAIAKDCLKQFEVDMSDRGF